MRIALLLILFSLAGCLDTASDPAAVSSAPSGTDPDATASGTDADGAASSAGEQATAGNDTEPSDAGSGDGNGTTPPREPGPDGRDGNGTQNNTREGNETRPFEPQGTNKACNSLALVTPESADPAGLVTGWPELQIEVAMVADPYFAQAHADWDALLRDLVADASVHYVEQFGISIKVDVVAALPDGTLTDSASPDLIWDTARGYMQANHPDSDHDYVAVILGADYNGATAGQVQCVHGAYDQETAYLWSEYTDPRGPKYDDYIGAPVDLMLDIPLKVFMHETAHLLAAHHHYTNCGEAMVSYGLDDGMAACGVMINDIGLASFTFSPTNRLIVRSFTEETGIGEPA